MTFRRKDLVTHSNEKLARKIYRTLLRHEFGTVEEMKGYRSDMITSIVFDVDEVIYWNTYIIQAKIGLNTTLAEEIAYMIR